MADKTPPIKYALIEMLEFGPGQMLPERYDTKDEALAVLDKMENKEAYALCETR